MTRRELCVRAFPRAWRERYGAELVALLAESAERGAWSESAELVRAGLAERARAPRRRARRGAVLAAGAAAAAAAILPAALAPAVSRPPARSPMSVAVVVLHTSPAGDAASTRTVRRLTVRTPVLASARRR